MRNRIFVLLTIPIMCVAFFLGKIVYAEDYAGKDSSVGFSVAPNYNDSQNKESSFFDLLVRPNSKQLIGVTIINTSQEVSSYTVKVVQASTNKNGVIDYSDSNGRLVNVPFKLSEHVYYEEHIILGVGESKQVPITVNIPEIPFKGEVLGGVNVTKELPKKDDAPQLVNQYSYVIGLRIREGEKNPERDLSAGVPKPVVSFGNPGVTMPIINVQTIAMGQLQVTSVLKKNDKIIKQASYDNREIAPNSIYPYSLSWDRKDYTPGKYELNVTVKDVQNHTWIFKKEFELSADEVTKVKNDSLRITKSSNTWIWVVVIIGLLIILVLIWYIIKLRKNRE